jgi:hypothetical protein
VVLYAGSYVMAIDRRLPDRAMTVRIVAAAGASLVVLLPFHLPYVAVQRAWEASWTPGAMAGYSADVQSYVSAPALLNDPYCSEASPPCVASRRLRSAACGGSSASSRSSRSCSHWDRISSSSV